MIDFVVSDVNEINPIGFHKDKHYSVLVGDSKCPIILVFAMEFMNP